MRQEKIARLSNGEIRFSPLVGDSYADEIVLGYNQKVSLNRSVETKELLSNDDTLGATAAEIETKVTYDFTTEIADLNIQNLAIAFRGAFEEKSYQVGDMFWNGKRVVDGSNTVTASAGTPILKDNKIYILTQEASAQNFDDLSLAKKSYSSITKQLTPETRTNNIGRIIVDGKNMITGKAQILVIPKINLKFDGEFAVVADDFIKLSLSGKLQKVENEPIFTLIDGE